MSLHHCDALELTTLEAAPRLLHHVADQVDAAGPKWVQPGSTRDCRHPRRTCVSELEYPDATGPLTEEYIL